MVDSLISGILKKPVPTRQPSRFSYNKLDARTQTGGDMKEKDSGGKLDEEEHERHRYGVQNPFCAIVFHFTIKPKKPKKPHC